MSMTMHRGTHLRPGLGPHRAATIVLLAAAGLPWPAQAQTTTQGAAATAAGAGDSPAPARPRFRGEPVTVARSLLRKVAMCEVGEVRLTIVRIGSVVAGADDIAFLRRLEPAATLPQRAGRSGAFVRITKSTEDTEVCALILL